MEIKKAQEMIRDLYFERDEKRGLEKNFIWFIEEVGEFAEGLKNNDMNCIEEEIADVFAWLLSLANVLNINLEKAFLKKYNNRCPYCGKNPCECRK